MLKKISSLKLRISGGAGSGGGSTYYNNTIVDETRVVEPEPVKNEPAPGYCCVT